MKDKQCLTTIEKFKSVVKDMLKASGMDKTANQTLSGSDVTALGDQSQDETQVETGAAGTEGGAERLAAAVEDNNMEIGSHILMLHHANSS